MHDKVAGNYGNYGSYGSYNEEDIGSEGLAFMVDDSQNRKLAYSGYSYIQQQRFPDIIYSCIARVISPRFLYCLTIPEFPRITTPHLTLR